MNSLTNGAGHPPPRKKKKKSPQQKETASINDWIDLFEKFQEAQKSNPKLSRSSFLKSKQNDTKITFSGSVANRFSRDYPKFLAGKLKRSNNLIQEDPKNHDSIFGYGLCKKSEYISGEEWYFIPFLPPYVNV